MRISSPLTSSWIMLALAAATWCAAGFFAYELMNMQSEREAYMRETAQLNLEQGQAAQLHSLFKQTIEERAMLDSTASKDVLTAVRMIESIGSTVKAKVSVTGAQTEKINTTKSGAASGTNIIALSVHAEGSFAVMMRVLQMLETLPLATTVQSVSLTRSADESSTKNMLWDLNVALRFYTTATAS